MRAGSAQSPLLTKVALGLDSRAGLEPEARHPAAADTSGNRSAACFRRHPQPQRAVTQKIAHLGPPQAKEDPFWPAAGEEIVDHGDDIAAAAAKLSRNLSL